MTPPCPFCDDTGLLLVERPNGSRAARECDCRQRRRLQRAIDSAQIPEKFSESTLENYETNFDGVDRSQAEAHLRARQFVREFKVVKPGVGLLLTGTIGTGKTHLAVGILRDLIEIHGVQGIFCTFDSLLKQIQNSYNRQVQTTELEILAPIMRADVLVIDEFGASRPTDWVKDTVAHILNTRYNERRTTIITTNYPNAAETSPQILARLSDPERAMFRETLGDRIGARMYSRLQEMCVVFEIQGVDFRQTVNLARFG